MSEDNPPVDHVMMDDADDSGRIEEHYKSKSTWLRLAFMLVFYVLGSLTAFVAMVVVVLGFFWVLFTGETNKQLQQVGKGIAAYVGEIICYLTYNSDTKPFPFDAEWPSAS